MKKFKMGAGTTDILTPSFVFARILSNVDAYASRLFTGPARDIVSTCQSTTFVTPWDIARVSDLCVTIDVMAFEPNAANHAVFRLARRVFTVAADRAFAQDINVMERFVHRIRLGCTEQDMTPVLLVSPTAYALFRRSAHAEDTVTRSVGTTVVSVTALSVIEWSECRDDEVVLAPVHSIGALFTVECADDACRLHLYLTVVDKRKWTRVVARLTPNATE
jgi:hypothetical protein